MQQNYDAQIGRLNGIISAINSMGNDFADASSNLKDASNQFEDKVIIGGKSLDDGALKLYASSFDAIWANLCAITQFCNSRISELQRCKALSKVSSDEKDSETIAISRT